jgi:hypothetical protein
MKSINKSVTLKKSIIILFVALAVYSCKKSSSPRPTTTQVSFGVKADNPMVSLAASVSNTVNLTAATPIIQFNTGMANITKFKLGAIMSNMGASMDNNMGNNNTMGNNNMEIETNGLMNVDLFATMPSLVHTSMDTGMYKEMEVGMVFTQSATGTMPLILKGSFTAADGTLIPVEIDVNENLTILASAKNVVVHNVKDMSTIVMLHLDKIVAGITAADMNAAVKTAGVIIISSTSNMSLYNKIKLNVVTCGDTEVQQM